MTTTELQLAAIKIDAGTQARVEINEAAVAEYAEAMTAGEHLPPPVVFFDGANYFLADGFHRYHANRRIGAVSWPCDVRTGTLADAKLYAYGANRQHGLRRTNEDKRKAVLGMLADFPDWSDRAIARHVGVDDKTVGAARKRSDCGNSAVTATERTYTTRHGTTATMDVSGQQRAAKERAAAPAPAEQPQAAATTPSAADPAPAAELLPAKVKSPAPQLTAPAEESAEALRTQLQQANDTINELAESLKATVADNEAMAKVFEADDKLAAAMAENDRLRSQVAGLRERVNGLMNEKNEATRLVKYWKGRAERAEKAAA